jgi:putative oxidoreductase
LEDIMPTLVTFVTFLRRLAAACSQRLGWLPPTLARVSVGYVFYETGWGKLHNLPRIVDYFRALGIPYPELQAPLASATEFVCGSLVLIGLLTRLNAIPLIVTMLVAIATAKADDITTFSDVFGSIEYLYIVLLAWVAIAGPGPLSVDYLLGRFLARERQPGSPTVTAIARGV